MRWYVFHFINWKFWLWFHFLNIWNEWMNVVRRNYFMVRGRHSFCSERLRFYCTTHPFQVFAVSNIGLLEWVGCLPSVSTCQVPGSSLASGLSVLPTRGQVPFFVFTYPTLKALVRRVRVPTRSVEVSDSTTPQEWYLSWSQDSVNLPGFCLLFCHSPPFTRLLIVYKLILLLILVILTRPCVCFRLIWPVLSLLVLYLLVLSFVLSRCQLGRQRKLLYSRRNPNSLFS